MLNWIWVAVAIVVVVVIYSPFILFDTILCMWNLFRGLCYASAHVYVMCADISAWTSATVSVHSICVSVFVFKIHNTAQKSALTMCVMQFIAVNNGIIMIMIMYSYVLF